MLSTKTSRWFGFLLLLMLALRLGYKYYHSQQPTATGTYMTNAETRKQALLKAVEAGQQAQRANGATVAVADSALATADTTAAK